MAALRELTGGEANMFAQTMFSWVANRRMKLQVIFNMLIEHGVDTVFGYSGGKGPRNLQRWRLSLFKVA